MEADSVEDAAEWDVVPAGRGHDGLRTLAANGFSGGVTDGRVWAMLTNGRVVGVVGGDVDDLADADLTAHEAPDPALSLLLLMREQSGEPRAQYYTEETPLREADERLRDGGFTGYVELAENVLSGDYYVVYYGGERMPLAFVGGSRRLESGEEAFDRAADEVGIYGVFAVDVSVVDVPGGETPAAAGGAGGDADDADGSAASDDAVTATTDDRGGNQSETGDADEHGSGDVGARAGGPVAWDVEAGVDTEADDDEVAEDAETADEAGGDADSAGVESDDEAEEAGADPDATAASAESDAPEAEADGEGGATTRDEGPGTVEAGDDDGAGDPLAASDGVVEDGADGDDEGDAEATTAGAGGDRIAALRDERDELRERVEALTGERDELRERVERLREELERVEHERDELRGRLGTAGDTMSPTAALSGTNLFVRYRSKAEPTLDRALDDGTEREAVDENLLLERHTSFETEGVTVGGQPYDEFLASTLQYRFVEWLVRALPFELRDAAGKRPLGRLYKSIPAFDRAEIDGTVTVRTAEGDAERSFDVVVRDRKGAPLAAASLFDGREPATEAMLSELVEDARAAAAANESFGAALFVTTSYYAPEALKRAEAETRDGGLFNRGSRESYVRLDRSHGFHLCLVEARDDDFHLGVPDL
ncbi:MAG: hypothetical protein V5A31_03745 [Haloferacaceae archaeon]